MLRNAFERLPLIFLVGAPLAGVAWFLAPYDLEAASGPFRLALYALYALSVAAIAFTYYRFIRKSSDGLVAAWLVIAFYLEVFFGLTLLGILTLLTIRFVHPDPVGFEAALVVRAIYGLIGASATSTTIGAVAALVGYRRGLLGRRIRPFPFGRKKERDSGA